MPSHPPAEPPPQQAPSSPNKGRFKGILEAIKGKVLTPDVPALEFEPGPNTVSYEDYIGEGSFPGGFGPGDRPLSELPNYEKLTRTERWVQGKLAGVSAPVAKVLGKLNEGFLGKVLTVLDAPSEFIERTAGLSAQALAAVGTEETWSEFTNNLRNAWDAGTFAFDFTNLPIRKDGQIVFDDDLPGIDGVINARLRLTELTDGGMSNDDALEQVRAEVYEDAGALALRMQLHDAFFRIVGDPINLFLPRLKLVDRAKVGLLRRTAGKAVPELVETALRSVDEAATVGKITAEQADVGRAFIKSLPELTPWDERWMKVTGAIEFNGRAGTILADNELTGLAKFLRGRWNPFGLTPASRAHGLAVNLTDNVIAALAGTVDNPDEAVRLIVAAADGTFDPRIAHMIITNEGAMARGLLQGFSSEAQKLGNAWNLTKPNRNIFNFLRSSMGDDGNDLLVRMLQADEMQPIFTRAIESLGDNQDEFVRLLTSAGIDPNITPEKLFEIFEPLAKRGMLNTETFTGRLINEIGDFSAKAAATKFGVPTRGFISKMADLMKSAESMAFLRINPGYFVRNLVNGEMTGIGRMGIFRYVKGGAQKFLDRVGISPTRLRAGFGISGDVPEYYKKIAGGQEALKAIDDAILAASKGDASAMTKLADNIRGTKLPLDFGALSAKVESNQSFYMTAQSISEWMTKFHQAPEMPVALRSALGENRAVELTRAVANSLNDLEIEDVFLKTDAAINGRAVLDDASSAFGEDIMRTIKPSEAREMADDLIDAYKKSGPTGVRDEVAKIRGDVTQRYSEALKEATDEITKNIIDHVQHGGIDSALHYHSGMLDEFWGTVHGKYVDEFGSVFEQIKNADPKVASGLWETVRVRTRTYWDESWDLFEAQSKAITKGLNAWGKDAGQKFPWTADYANSFKSWRKGWEGFWKTRDTLIDEWVQARKAGKPIAYDTIRGQIDELYATTIAEEDVLFRQLDSLMARGVPEDFRAFYKAGREEIAGIRQLMREHVQRFQVDPLGDGRAYIDLTADEQIQAYQQFWRDRKGFLDEIVQSERKSRAAMRGDGEALGSYANAITNNETLDSARAAILAGEDLTEEQIEAIAKAREFLPETAELKRLRAEFGEFSDEVVEAKAKQWVDAYVAPGPKLGDKPGTVSSLDPIADKAGSIDVSNVEGVNSTRWFHGSGTSGLTEESVDALTTRPNNLFGPGIYVSNNPRVAKSYSALRGGKTGTPTLYAANLELKKILNADDVIPANVQELMQQSMRGGLPDWADDFDEFIIANPDASYAETYKKFQRILSDANVDGDIDFTGATEIAQDLNLRLRDLDFDAVGYTGGVRTGGETHQALVILDPLDAAGLGTKSPVRAFEEVSESVNNVHDALRQWAFNDAEWKDEIIRLAQEDPNAIKEIQDFSQWMLREQGFDNLKLYGGKLRVYRGEAEVRLDELNLQAWDSFSPSKAIARQNAGPGGTMIELDIPVENIFTHVDAHPGFTFKGEREFMLNGTGIDGSRVVSINGNVPTPDELDILKNINPGLVVDAPFNANSLPDAEGVIGRIMPQDQGLFELWNMKGSKALDAIGESVIARGKRPPIKLDDLDDAARSQIRSYIEQSKANLASSRYQAIKFGEWRRDGALLNYSRRLNYNTWLGTVMPFEFWTTTSIRKWALHTLNRPTMTSTYLRLQDFLDKGYRPENGLPNRLKGQIRINAPFLPDFLGDSIFVDPLQLALPFKQWEYAIDSLTQNESRDAGRARRVLDELMNDEEITEQEYAQAIASESGPAWDRAISLARLDDTEGRTNAFDFMSLLTAPHAPIAWAYQALKGTPENIRPVLPLTRTVKGVTALLGIGPAGGVNIEGNIREFLGLPRFDKWDDYRTNRMLSNMVADQELTVQEAGLAMTSKQGEDYEEAKRRAGIEFGIGALGSTIGLPLKPYPPGEEFLRKLKDEYEAAWVDYERGDDTALNDFYTENPSYESRQLALEFEPEEQLRRFLVDQIWDKWNNLTVQNKRDVADGLGEVFQTAFLNKETRSLDNISSDMMQAWLQIMGGDTPGKVEWDQDLRPIELTPPTIARRLDAFYLTRSQNFRYNENVAPLWDTYFKLDKDARKKFFRENPILQQYIDWRNDFMFRNPELAPYVEDDPDKLPTFESLEELQEAEAAQPNFTWMEWQNVLTLPMWRLARDMLRYGEGMGDDEIEELIDVADGLGIEFEELMFRLEGAYEEAEGEFANPTAVP